MATVGHSFVGINANTKALRVGGLLVIADGLTKEQIMALLGGSSALRGVSPDATLEDSIAIDDGG